MRASLHRTTYPTSLITADITYIAGAAHSRGSVSSSKRSERVEKPPTENASFSTDDAGADGWSVVGATTQKAGAASPNAAFNHGDDVEPKGACLHQGGKREKEAKPLVKVTR